MELYVIGDLQLGGGGTGDDFRADDERALVSFLFRLSRVPGAELVLNGDIIDFTQIGLRSQPWYDERLGTSEDDSLLKLERALLAHGPVWDALGRFVAAGGRLQWIIGDRDADIRWPRAQALLRERIAPLDDAALGFGYVLQRDGVHIQHGHESDPLAGYDSNAMLLDPRGVPRLERTLGVRFAEEFSAVLDNLDGWEMIDNTHPRIPAAMLVLRQALPDRSLHVVLVPAVRVLLDSLATLSSEDEIGTAAHRLGISRQSLGWLASVAGWFSTLEGEDASLRVPEVASLRRAFAYGAGLEDGAQLAQFAPPALPGVWPQLPGMPTQADRRAAARRLYDDHAAVLQYAGAVVARRHELRAVCFGHTQRAIDARLRVDDAPGWPIPDAHARYFNSGCWGRALFLADVAPEQRSAAFVADPAHHRVLRDYLRVAWLPDGEQSVETLAWS